MKSATINPTHVTTRELERTTEMTRHRVGDHNAADRSRVKLVLCMCTQTVVFWPLRFYMVSQGRRTVRKSGAAEVKTSWGSRGGGGAL